MFVKKIKIAYHLLVDSIDRNDYYWRMQVYIIESMTKKLKRRKLVVNAKKDSFINIFFPRVFETIKNILL